MPSIIKVRIKGARNLVLTSRAGSTPHRQTSLNSAGVSVSVSLGVGKHSSLVSNEEEEEWAGASAHHHHHHAEGGTAVSSNGMGNTPLSSSKPFSSSSKSNKRKYEERTKKKKYAPYVWNEEFRFEVSLYSFR